MTYSIVVTILLIITVILLIMSLGDAAGDKERLERKVLEANSQFNNESCKVLRLADKADSLSRQVRWLESQLEGEKQKVRDVNELREHQR
jgi:hypothetical protein